MLVMLRWLKSKIRSRKAQFFIISTVIVASVLSSISGHLQGYGEITLSEGHGFEEIDVFRNLKEQMNKTVVTINCGPNDQPRKRNLQDFKIEMGKDLKAGGIDLNITYDSYCPANAHVTLKSSKAVIQDEFSLP